jgi:hypothetical protein
VLKKVIPVAGNIDLSSLAFIIVAQLLLVSIFMPLENSLLASLIK